jgi:acyl carrier protein
MSECSGDFLGGFLMPTRDEVFERVSTTLVESLNVEPEEVTPESTLQGDLGAESIDFLDIIFRLERGFGIKIDKGELFPEAIFQGDPRLVQNGKVTPDGITELRTRLPFADVEKFAEDPQVGKISELFTVEMITKYIEGKLGSNGNGTH